MRFSKLYSSLTALVMGAAFAATASAQESVYQDTVHGEIVATGNTLGLDHKATPEGNAAWGGIGVFIANPLRFGAETVAGFPLAGLTKDWRHNGSSAFLDLGEATGVEHAELVWACSSKVSVLMTEIVDMPSSVTFTLPNGTAVPVAPDDEIRTLQLINANYQYYQRWADVTDLVAEAGSGFYTVSEVVGTANADTSQLTACGWTLVVATSANALPLRNLNIWVVGKEIRANGKNSAGETCPCNLDIELSDFCTPATPARASGRMVVSAMEGDAYFEGDTLQIRNPAAPATYLKLAGPNNARENFFTSQINGNDGLIDVEGTFGDRNHAAGLAGGKVQHVVANTRQGWDITRIPLNDTVLNSGVLTNNQTVTAIKATTTPGGDDYILNAITMELDVASPLIQSQHVVDRTATFVGDVVTATVTLTNAGYARADTVAFCYEVPDNTTLEAVSVDGAARNGVSATSLALTGCAQGTGGMALGAMEVNATRVVTLKLRVTQIDATPAAFDRVRVLEGWRSAWTPSCIGASLQSDAQTGTRHAIGAPLLEVTLTVTPTTAVDGGETLTYTVTVRNVGTAPSSGAEVIAGIPEGTTYVAGSTTLNGQAVPDAGGAGAYEAGHEVHQAGAEAGVVNAGGSAVVTYQVVAETPASGDGADVTHQVFVDPDGGRGAQGERPSNEVRTRVNGEEPGPEPQPEPGPEPQPEPQPELQPEATVDPCTLAPNNCYLVEGGACAAGGADTAMALGLGLAGLALMARRRRRLS